MILTFVGLLLASRSATSSVPARGEVSEPETRIKIILPAPSPARKKSKAAGPKLPSDWPERAAKTLSSKTVALSTCFKSPGLKDKQIKFIALLSVDSKGEANWLDREQAPLEEASRVCMAEVVAQLRFPSHPLPNPIHVRVPLELGLSNQEVTHP